MSLLATVMDNFDQNYFLYTALFTICYQLSFFTIAFYFKFDKVTDFAGGTNFVILAFMTYFGSQPVDFRATVATALIAVWGARLSGFLLYRILKTEEDTRFDELRGDFFKFLGFWIFQMIWVWVCSLPVIMVNCAGNSSFAPEFGTFTDIIGVLMFATGLVVETLADSAKFAFRESQPKPLDILRTGVWKYSRHPNYFGEILLWWGVYVLCLPVSSKTGVYTVASPLFISWLLLFVSGIPLSEPPKEKKYVEANKQPEYQEYIDTTSPLIPMPNETYRNIPGFVKSTFLFELPLYRYTSDGKATKSE